MARLGTNYGGWYVPINLNLNEKSIVYFLNQNQEYIDKYLETICQKTNKLRLKLAKSLLDNDDKKNL